MKYTGFHMGIERPVSTEDQLKIQSDVSAMRKAVTFAQRDSALVGRCLRMAEHMGLSGEETYVLIAYNALVELEAIWQRHLELSALDIRRHLFMPEPLKEPK